MEWARACEDGLVMWVALGDRQTRMGESRVLPAESDGSEAGGSGSRVLADAGRDAGTGAAGAEGRSAADVDGMRGAVTGTASQVSLPAPPPGPPPEPSPEPPAGPAGETVDAAQGFGGIGLSPGPGGEPADQSSAQLLWVAPEQVQPNPYQPRTVEDPGELNALAESIRAHGVLQPLVVVRSSERPDVFVLVAGERRLRAARQLGLGRIPVRIVEMSPREMAEAALIENLQRKNLSAVEEARAYQRLMEEFGLTQELLAGRLGRSQSSVANKLRLLRLSAGVQELISREIISERHARALLRLESAEEQERLAREIVDRQLSVAQAEALVRQAQAGKRSSRKRKVVYILKDARLFRNSVLQMVRQMRENGIPVEWHEEGSAQRYWIEVVVGKRPTRRRKAAVQGRDDLGDSDRDR